MKLDWTTRPPRDGKTVITAIDMHAAGEPLRILTGGLPPLPGASILDLLGCRLPR
jgi:trans-L-3-hydroxyproline dehydratase